MTIERCTNSTALMRLATWLSPAFPTGAFSYSSGLETAYADGVIKTQSDLQAWISWSLTAGSIWNDLILCAAAHRQNETIADLCELGCALAPSKERFSETFEQGSAFIKAAAPWVNKIEPQETCPLPIAVGMTARASEIPVDMLMPVFAQAQTSNLVQAAMRMGNLGQHQGVEILASLEETQISTANKAVTATLDDLGTATLFADLLTLKHETTEPRIFRS